MKKVFFSLSFFVLLLGGAITASGQQLACPSDFTPTLSLEPFMGVSRAIIPTRELTETHTYYFNGQNHTYTTYFKDEHNPKLGLEGGLRTRLQLNEKWGIKAETGFQQLQYGRKTLQKVATPDNSGSDEKSGSMAMLYFYQSLEANYRISNCFSTSAGGFAGTLLSSYQNNFGLTDEEKVSGKGLRTTRLGLQASVSYEHTSGLTATFNVRQDLKSIYTSEAQPAGAISPTSLSLTLGYRFVVAK